MYTILMNRIIARMLVKTLPLSVDYYLAKSMQYEYAVQNQFLKKAVAVVYRLVIVTKTDFYEKYTISICNSFNSFDVWI